MPQTIKHGADGGDIAEEFAPLIDRQLEMSSVLASRTGV